MLASVLTSIVDIITITVHPFSRREGRVETFSRDRLSAALSLFPHLRPLFDDIVNVDGDIRSQSGSHVHSQINSSNIIPKEKPS
jgi:hypothetical protein